MKSRRNFLKNAGLLTAGSVIAPQLSFSNSSEKKLIILLPRF
ncbi:twin-arginine translocation signal domain-containing protein [Mesonia mobilis]|nr:twin-arginine translocation signal domain-containing protein [Aquimarina celericrescens]